MLTPYQLWEAYRNHRPKFPCEAQVKGIYEGLNSSKEYGGFYFGRLKDPKLGGVVTLKIPVGLVPAFEELKGKTVVVEGTPYADVKPNFSKVEIVLTVRSVNGVEEGSVDPLTEFKVIASNRFRVRKGELTTLLLRLLENGNRPKVALVVGQTAIVDEDVFRALGPERETYEIRVSRTSLASPSDLVETVKALEQEGIYHFLAVVRGGGEGREVFDRLDVLSFFADLRLPFVTALGHAEDVHLLDLIADKSFPTPSVFGVWLRRIAEEARSKKEVKKVFVQSPPPRQSQSQSLLPWIIVLLLLGALAYLLLKGG